MAEPGRSASGRHSCVTCAVSYTYRSNLERHVRERHADQRHVCDRCGATFARRYRLEAHVRTHAGHEPFQCSLCPATAASRAGLARHVRCHAAAGGGTACPDCGQLFTHYWRMKLHRRHHQAPRHGCRLCGRLFRHGRGLADHQLAEHAPAEAPPQEPPELQIELDPAELEGELGAELAQLLCDNVRMELQESTGAAGEAVMVITLVDE